MFQICKKFVAALMLSMMCLNSFGESVTIDVSSGNLSNWNLFEQTADVTLENLTLTGGEWRGVCFPFTATKEQLDATLGEGQWQLRTFDKLVGSTVYTAEATSVSSDIPYVIYVETTIENPVFTGVTLTSSSYIWSNLSVSISGSDELTANGYYFSTYLSSMINYSDSNYAYLITSTGGLESIASLDDAWSGSRTACVWLYNGTNSTTLKLKLDDSEEEEDTEESGSGYTYDESTLQGKIERRYQLTDVPTLYLTLPDVAEDGSDLNSVVYKDGNTAEYHDAAMVLIGENNDTIDSELSDDSGYYLEIKVRGNSTSYPDKKAYRMKFAKKHKHDMMDCGYDKRNWTLLANVFDRSLIRNAVTYHLGEALGMPFSAGYRFVDLVINNSYRGTYQISDQIEADADRVNVDEDTGWMFEFVSQNRFLDDYYIEDFSPLTNIKNPDGDDYVADEETSTMTDEWTELVSEMKTFVNNWNTGLSGGDYNTVNWRDYNDEETLIKFYLISNLSGDYDGFFTIKAYKEAADKYLSWGPIWDKDIAYGNCMNDPSEDTMIENISNGNFRYYFTNNLNSDADFVTHTKMVLDKVIEDGLEDMLLNKVDELGSLVAQSWALNFDTWDVTAAVTGEIAKIYGSNYATQDQHIAQLKEWISNRVAFVKNTIDEEYASLGSPSTTVTVSIGSEGIETFSYPLTLDFSQTGASVYTATVSGDKVTLTQITDGIVPAGTGVVIKGTANSNITPTLVTDWKDKLTGNELISTHPAVITATDELIPYALSTVDDVTAFYPLEVGDELAQYKAYLTASSTDVSVLYLDNTTTAITKIASDTNADSDAPAYNIQGVKVSDNYKGIVIQKGKKYVVK